MKMRNKVGFSIVVKMSILYLVFGLLWIRFSDALVYHLIKDSYLVTQIQTYKGWFYVLTTSLLLYYILKRVYYALSHSREEYENLFSINRDGLIFVSFDGKIKHVNESFLKFFQTDYNTALKSNYQDVMKVDWEDGEEGKLADQLLTRGYTDIYTKDATLIDGSIAPFEVQSYKINFKNEVMICSVVRDISSSQKMMNELKLAKETAEESDRLKTAFLQNMSHEIRTPMNGIIGFSEMLRSPSLSYEKRTNYIDTIIKSSNQLLNIVTDVLDISRIETGQVVIKEKEFNINELLYQLFQKYSSMASEKNIQLSISKNKPDHEAIILADKEKIRQVYKNLLNNALKFTEKGTIRFGYKIAHSEILFFVSDTGLGIPPGLQGKIFERFRKGEVNLLKDYGGTGLGLAICKGNMDLMKGEIWVESEVGNGAQFYFSIPNKAIHHKEAHKKSYNGLTVLVAEDEDINFKYIQEVFKNHEINLDRAFNGTEAVLKIAEGQKYDIIFMDVRMPKMDGYQATREIRKLNKQIPIIAQTAFVQEENRYDAIQAGCNDYVSKPIKQSDLFLMIERYVPQTDI